MTSQWQVTSMQKPTSMVIESRQARTLRLNQSMTAARYPTQEQQKGLDLLLKAPLRGAQSRRVVLQQVQELPTHCHPLRQNGGKFPRRRQARFSSHLVAGL
jgi:hypothetical protein